MRSLHSRLWLQLLSSQDLIDITVSSYDAQSGWESEEHNARGLWSWETAAVEKYFGGREKVLVAAAGAGREMIALAGTGFQVSGFDVSADLVQNGIRNLAKAGVAAELQVAPPCQVPDNLGTYDALFVGRGAYHHIPGRDRRIGFLRACGEHLGQHSPILIGDVQARKSTRVGRRGRREEGDVLSSAFFHYFNKDELQQEMHEAGFELLECRPTPFPGGGNLLHAIGRLR